MVSFEKDGRFEYQRRQMVQYDLKGRDITDLAVIEVMSTLPRERFVPANYSAAAYDDCPLPIGLGQTISQPYIVALMTQCLKLTGSEEVLEIGTGSGYQTAILSKLCKKVYTIERFDDLLNSAQNALSYLGIANVEFYVGDGSLGWPDPEKKFDRVIITAAVPQPPDPVLKQLRDAGLLVAPVGSKHTQELIVYEKQTAGPREKFVCGCRFVKLIGKYGFPAD